MKAFETARKLFSEKCYQDSFDCLKRGIESTSLDEKEVGECYHLLAKLISIYPLPNIRNIRDIRNIKKKLADFFYKEKQYVRALEFYQEVLEERQDSDTFYSAWKCFKDSGQVQELVEFSKLYLNYLHGKKRAARGLCLIDELEAHLGKEVFIMEYKLRFFILEYNIEAIDKLLALDIKKLYRDKVCDQKNLIDIIIKSIPLKNALRNLKCVKSAYLWGELGKKILPERKKKLINVFFDYLLDFPLDAYGYAWGLEFSHKYDFDQLRNTLTRIFQEKKEIFKKDKWIREFIKNIGEKGFINKKERGNIFNFYPEGFPHAYFSNREKRLEKRKIKVKNIDVARPSNKETEDEDNFLNIQKVEKKLLEEIEKNIVKYDQNEEGNKEEGNKEEENKELVELKRVEDSIGNSLDALDKNLIMSSYQDLFVMLCTINLYDLAEKILAYKQEKRPDHNYLKVRLLIGKENFYKALELVEETLTDFSLSKEEKLCFLYLKAEILELEEKMSNALEVYKTIYKMNSEYRLVKYKVKKIEKIR